MIDGRITTRTTRASKATAAASPRPSSLNSIMLSDAKTPEDRHHHHRRAGHHSSRFGDAGRDGLAGRQTVACRLLDAAHHEHVVVHGQSEKDDEQEERYPCHHRAGGVEV
jgi:hypothetical protein